MEMAAAGRMESIRMKTPLETLRMDRTVFSVGKLKDEDKDGEYWRSRSWEERLEAAEFMRQVVYGYDPITDRVQRVFTVTRLGES
jgi:hypothetical protein